MLQTCSQFRRARKCFLAGISGNVINMHKIQGVEDEAEGVCR